jgi:hypothetical protein
MGDVGVDPLRGDLGEPGLAAAGDILDEEGSKPLKRRDIEFDSPGGVAD